MALGVQPTSRCPPPAVGPALVGAGGCRSADPAVIRCRVFSLFFLSGLGLGSQAELWNAGVAYTQFTEYWTPSDAGIGALYNLTEVMGVPSVVHTPIIHARAPHTAILDAVAGFLIGAGGAAHSYLMYVAASACVLPPS